MRPINLATEPFRNRRGPALVFTLALLLVAGITAVHARVLFRLLQPGGTDVHRRVAALDAEVARLRQAVNEGRRTPPPDKAQLARWALVKELVDRRTFSWTELLAHFEELLPIEVRLMSVAPTVKGGRLELAISAIARPASAGLELIDVLQGRGPFAEVYPVSVSDRPGTGGTEFRYTMTYREAVRPMAAPAAKAESQTLPSPKPAQEAQPDDAAVDDGQADDSQADDSQADDSDPAPAVQAPARATPTPRPQPTVAPTGDEEEES